MLLFTIIIIIIIITYVYPNKHAFKRVTFQETNLLERFYDFAPSSIQKLMIYPSNPGLLFSLLMSRGGWGY